MTTEHQRNMFQFQAFSAFNKAALLGGSSIEEAFISAICGSSDEIVNGLLEKDSNVINKWINRRRMLIRKK